MATKSTLIKQVEGLNVPTFPYEWAQDQRGIFSHAIHLLGFEFDGTACFRKGTVKGPDAIREVSAGIESFSPYLDMDLEDYQNIYDLGNLKVGAGTNQTDNWQEATDQFFSLVEGLDFKGQKARFLLLGGEHSVSYAPIVSHLKAYDNLVLLHLDAHADLRDGYEGYHYSHASLIRRALDHFGKNHQLIQYGIRSGTREEYDWMREHKSNCHSLQELVERLEEIAPDRPIYLTLDLDFFDPCFLPGTGTPEPGGENFHNFIKINKILRRKNFVGADVVELSPDIDTSNNSSVFATKVVRELLLSLQTSLGTDW